MTMPIAVGMLLERRGQDNERDAAARYLRGRCAAVLMALIVWLDSSAWEIML